MCNKSLFKSPLTEKRKRALQIDSFITPCCVLSLLIISENDDDDDG